MRLLFICLIPSRELSTSFLPGKESQQQMCLVPGVCSDEKWPSTCAVRSAVSEHSIPHIGQVNPEPLLSTDIGVVTWKIKQGLYMSVEG